MVFYAAASSCKHRKLLCQGDVSDSQFRFRVERFGPVRVGSSPSPLAGPLNWVLMGSRAMFPTSLVSGAIRLEWYA